jgi:hypothetical protein
MLQVPSVLMPVTVFTPIVLLAECVERSIVLEACEHYQKRSFRNRYFLPYGNGLQMLSIPLRKGKNESLPIRQVEIADELPWREQHRKALQSIYGKSPYFIFYKEELFDLIEHGPGLLFDFNVQSLKWLLDKMKLDVQIQETLQYEKQAGADFLDLRSVSKPSILEGKQMPSYWGIELVSAQSSALDLLFHMGPESYSYLESIRELELLTKL